MSGRLAVFLPDLGTASFRAGFLREKFQFHRLVEDGIKVRASFREHALGEIGRKLIEVRLEREFAEIGQQSIAKTLEIILDESLGRPRGDLPLFFLLGKEAILIEPGASQ